MTGLVAALLLYQPAAGGFTQLSAQATEARMANRQQEAVGLYQRALKLNPKWDEGWFFLGSIYYHQERGADCAAAFARFTALKPNVSAGHAFSGLCQYQTGQFAGALASLDQAWRIGLPSGEQLTDVASYHAAQLHIKAGNFERALQILHFFTRRPQIDPKLIEAAGLAALRRPIFPNELAAEDRELIYRMGRAVMTADRRPMEADEQFRELLRDYPKAPNLHFAYGSFLLGGDAGRAIATLQQELEVQPEHLPTLVLLGLEQLKRGDAAPAKGYGERAVRVAPGNFTTHLVLGRALVALDEMEAGIRELEQAVKLEPASPQIRIALASAYQKAGNQTAAALHRAEFQRLKKALDEQEGIR